jgi:HTH-type transcriptional regulator/antitoxin HigA
MEPVTDLPAPRLLRTVEEYEVAVAEIDRLIDLDPLPETGEYGRLELLSLLVEDYDSRNHPIDDSDLKPQYMVDFVLDQKG